MSNKEIVSHEGVVKVTQVLNKECTLFEEMLFEGSKKEVSEEALWYILFTGRIVEDYREEQRTQS